MKERNKEGQWLSLTIYWAPCIDYLNQNAKLFHELNITGETEDKKEKAYKNIVSYSRDCAKGPGNKLSIIHQSTGKQESQSYLFNIKGSLKR